MCEPAPRHQVVSLNAIEIKLESECEQRSYWVTHIHITDPYCAKGPVLLYTHDIV